MSRQDATDLLMSEREGGVFLVRDSASIQGDYVLCVRWGCTLGFGVKMVNFKAIFFLKKVANFAGNTFTYESFKGKFRFLSLQTLHREFTSMFLFQTGRTTRCPTTSSTRSIRGSRRGTGSGTKCSPIYPHSSTSTRWISFPNSRICKKYCFCCSVAK